MVERVDLLFLTRVAVATEFTVSLPLAARCPRAIRISDGLIVDDGPGPQVALDNRTERARAANT